MGHCEAPAGLGQSKLRKTASRPDPKIGSEQTTAAARHCTSDCGRRRPLAHLSPVRHIRRRVEAVAAPSAPPVSRQRNRRRDGERRVQSPCYVTSSYSEHGTEDCMSQPALSAAPSPSLVARKPYHRPAAAERCAFRGAGLHWSSRDRPHLEGPGDEGGEQTRAKTLVRTDASRTAAEGAERSRL